jgi:RNA-binding protein YlmH
MSAEVRSLSVIVPSLRADVLGARAFRVSRAWFAKGIANGNVSVNGRPAGKSTQALAGDEVTASGLGSFTVISVDGETKKGNLKVTLEVRADS